MKLNQKALALLIISIFCFSAALALPVKATTYAIWANSLYNVANGITLQIVDNTLGTQTIVSSGSVSLGYNVGDSLTFLTYNTTGSTFQYWMSQYFVHVSTQANFTTTATALMGGSTYYPVYYNTVSQPGFNVVAYGTPYGTVTITDNTNSTVGSVTGDSTNDTYLDANVCKANLWCNVGDYITVTFVAPSSITLNYLSIQTGSNQSYYVYPVYSFTGTTYTVLTAIFTGSLPTPTPAPTASPTPSPVSYFGFDLPAFISTMTVLFEMAFGAVFVFLGVLIFMKASGAWVVGFILLIMGLLIQVLAQPNAYAVIFFVFEVCAFVPGLYIGFKSGNKKSRDK
jgi:hypothetical protein